MNDWTANLSYYFHATLNVMLNILIFLMLYLIAAKVLKNITTLLNIISI